MVCKPKGIRNSSLSRIVKNIFPWWINSNCHLLLSKVFIIINRKEKILFESPESSNYKNAVKEIKIYFERLYKLEHLKEIDLNFLNL